MTFTIVTDSTSDLPISWVQENDVTVLGLTINLDSVTYETVGENRLTSADLLEKMASGSQPTTSQVNVGQFEEVFEVAVKEGQEVLYLAFSANSFRDLPECSHCTRYGIGSIPGSSDFHY